MGGQVMERPAMTQDSNVLAAIDVGTSKVCTIIASRSNGRGLRVLGHSIVPSGGLEKGNVADVPAAEKAIRESVAAAERVRRSRRLARLVREPVGLDGRGRETRRDNGG